MKKVFILLFIVGSTFFLSTSCEKLSLPDEEAIQNNEAQKVKVIAKSTTSDIVYPLLVYAFDSSGQCKAKQTLSSSSENLSFSLSSGTYHLVALSNTEGYTIPSEPTLSSLIQMSDENNYSTSSLQMGQADIAVGESAQTVNITLAYKVATVNMALEQLPSSVTSVWVIVSQQNSSIDFNGEYLNAKSTKFQLSKSDEGWTGNVSVFPGASAQTVFSISVTDADSTTTYGYTYNQPLVSATPYNLKGTFSEGKLNVSASFISQDWNTPIDLVFNFGPDIQSGVINSTEEVSDFPTAGTIWNGHLVAYVYDDSGNILSSSDTKGCTSVKLLLLSLDEWTKVYSASNATSPTQAIDLASSYSENGLSGWTIPTVDEVQKLVSLYNVSQQDTMDVINTTINSVSGTPIVPLDSDGKNIRYLCENAEKAFSWRLSPNILSAGATIKYSLRLVNHVKVVKK